VNLRCGNERPTCWHIPVQKRHMKLGGVDAAAFRCNVYPRSRLVGERLLRERVNLAAVAFTKCGAIPLTASSRRGAEVAAHGRGGECKRIQHVTRLADTHGRHQDRAEKATGETAASARSR